MLAAAAAVQIQVEKLAFLQRGGASPPLVRLAKKSKSNCKAGSIQVVWLFPAGDNRERSACRISAMQLLKVQNIASKQEKKVPQSLNLSVSPQSQHKNVCVYA